MALNWIRANSAVLVLAACVLQTACTSVNVRPVATQERITSVVIEENPKVWRSDFIDVLKDGFARHGIESTVIQPGTPVGNAYVVRYTARQKWDMAMYMSDATIWIYKNDREVAKAVYHLKGGGGFSLMKWQGTATKIDPVIDQLLAGVGNGAKPAGATSGTAQAAPAGLDRPANETSSEPTSLAAMCDIASPIDKAECLGELRFGMTTNEILATLGRPDEMSEDGTMLRYGDRYLSLDEKSRLVAVTDSRPPAK